MKESLYTVLTSIIIIVIVFVSVRGHGLIIHSVETEYFERSVTLTNQTNNIIMGLCGSKHLDGHVSRGQSAALKAILMNASSSSSKDNISHPPSCLLHKQRDAARVDGVVFAELLRAGFVELNRGKDLCNKINVFPIPDGDTGNNMVITLRDAVAGIGKGPEPNLTETARSFALRTTLKAQGNSGTILSFVFNNIFQAIEARGKPKVLNVSSFVECLMEVSTRMMSAMQEPKRGTLLSVVGDTFDGAKGAQTVGELVDAMHRAGTASLKRTPDELIVNGKVRVQFPLRNVTPVRRHTHSRTQIHLVAENLKGKKRSRFWSAGFRHVD